MEHLTSFIGFLSILVSLVSVTLIAALQGRREAEDAPNPIQVIYGPPERSQTPTEAPTSPGTVPVESTVPGTVPSTVPESDTGDKLSYDNPKHAFHAARVICDELGLTVDQKNVLCACIYQESRFMNRRADGSPVINQNRDSYGNVWSTDYGIGQVNDYYHCSPGKTFPSVQYVMDNPEAVIRWMAGIMKRTGKLQPWSSYTSGAYRQWLSTTSPMWSLKS
jgi:hypothetical protein